VYEPAYRTNEALPALLWIHAGGYVVGNVHMDHAYCGAIVDALGVVVVSVDYSLAPEFNRHHALEECHDALHWLAHGSHGLHLDKARIAVGGASAGGGLAASVVQRATDDGHVQPCFQMLVYPMLDDRTCLREPADERLYRLATREALVLGWSVALGHAPGLDSVRPYAVPARRSDLKGLPPTWMGFGTADIFHDENEAYAQSLRDARVPVETHVVPGAFHAFDYVARGASVTREFRRRQIHALGRALFGAKGATEEKARPQGLHDGRG
jgi:acetyl esterase/lipase